MQDMMGGVGRLLILNVSIESSIKRERETPSVRLYITFLVQMSIDGPMMKAVPLQQPCYIHI